MYKGKPIYLLNPLNATREITLAIEAFHGGWLQFHSSVKPLHLHHYTTREGLNGILRNRSFWSSHIRSLNDPSEIQYGKAIVKDALDRALETEKNEAIVKMLKGLRNYVDVYDRILYDTYVTCFCEIEDLSSQWREYAGRGVGYSIGVTFDATTRFCHDLTDIENDSYIVLRKVLYERQQQEQLVTKYLDELRRAAVLAFEQFMKIWGKLPEVWESQAALQASNLLFDMMFTFKDAKYSGEHEWRMVKVMQPDFNPSIVKQRSSGAGKLNYINSYLYYSDLATYSPIDLIRVGPSADVEYLRSILDDILIDEHPIFINVDHIKILQSDLRIHTF